MLQDEEALGGPIPCLLPGLLLAGKSRGQGVCLGGSSRGLAVSRRGAECSEWQPGQRVAASSGGLEPQEATCTASLPVLFQPPEPS